MPDITVNITVPEIDVNINSPEIDIDIPVGAQGPQGPTGPAGGSVESYPAGEVMSSGRAVIISGGQAFYFQPSNATHVGRFFGVTKTSASNIGDSVDIQLSGTITDASFSFTPDTPVFAGANGVVTSTVPASGLSQPVGVSVDTTKIKIQPLSTLIL